MKKVKAGISVRKMQQMACRIGLVAIEPQLDDNRSYFSLVGVPIRLDLLS